MLRLSKKLSRELKPGFKGMMEAKFKFNYDREDPITMKRARLKYHENLRELKKF
jgi:hypothetical protein